MSSRENSKFFRNFFLMKVFSKILTISLIALFTQSANAEWVKQKANTFAWLHSVYFLDQNRGWIVGSKGTYLETKDGGNSWKTVKSVTQDNIRDIYFQDENTGWALCEQDVYSGAATSPSYILKTTDGGVNWANVNLENEGSERIARFFFSKNGRGWAVGEAGTVYEMTGGGGAWKKLNFPVRYLMLDGNFSSDTQGLIVGGRGSSLYTEDGGQTWNFSSFSKKSETRLNSVYFTNPKTGWAVGAEGRIYTTINGGKFWREQTSNTKKDLSDVFFLNGAEGWAIGDSGTILYTKTAGNLWIELEAPVTHKLEKVFFTGQKGWVVGFGGTILRYDPSLPNRVKPLPRRPILQRQTRSS